MAQRSVTREVPKLDLRADVVPASYDAEKRTVEVTWTTGARVKRGYWEPYHEELSLKPQHVRMDRLQSGAAPLLNSHRAYDMTDVVGVVENAKLSGKSGTATVRFARSPEGDAAMALVADGIMKNVSVGYRVHKLVKVEDGEDKVPVYRAEDWEPFEISLVPIGADAGAVVRSAGGMTPCVFIDEEREMPDPVPTPTPAPTETPAPLTDAQRAEVARLERERVLGIQTVARKLGRPDAEAESEIAKGTTLDAYRAIAIDGLAKAPADQGGPITFERGQPQFSAGLDERDKYRNCAEGWLLQRSGTAHLVEAAAQKSGKKVDLDPGMCRGMTLVDLARDSLQRAGVNTRGMDVMQMVGMAFTHRAGNTTSDFPIILENALNKSMLGQYATTPDTWRSWCYIGTVTDFRAHNRYRMGSLGVFDDLPEGGEYKNATLPDAEKQTITATTKGRMISISRQTIVNDDMGVFNESATRLGRSAALTLEVLAYTTLLSNSGNGPTMGDGNPLFHASHSNIGAGGAALSVATVDADRVLMAQQKDPSGNEILELRPAILLLPVSLGGQARVINSSQYDVDKVANARNQEPNKVAGLYRNIVDTARLTGTTRYSFTDPNINPVIEMAFLNGNQNPYLEMMQEWRVDGVSWKSRLDVACAGRDWRGVVRNPGV